MHSAPWSPSRRFQEVLFLLKNFHHLGWHTESTQKNLLNLLNLLKDDHCVTHYRENLEIALMSIKWMVK